MAVSPCAAHIDCPVWGMDRYHARAQFLGRSRNLDAGFAAFAQPREEACNVLIRHAEVQNGGEGQPGSVLFKRFARVGQLERGSHARSFTRIPARAMKLASIAWPCSVAMLSGWNWTPWIGNVA